MYKESAISIFRKLPETKSQVEQYGRLIKSAVLNGEVDPLLFWQQVTALEKLIENIKSDLLVKDVVLEEAEKYGKSFAKYSAKFQIKEMGTRFDFTNCQDVEWEQLTADINRLKSKIKQREELLKTINADVEIYGADGIRLEPAIKKSTTGISITLND
jgi:hypothetical protein